MYDILVKGFLILIICLSVCDQRASQTVLVVKNPTANPGDIRDGSSIPGFGRPPGEGHGNPLQYSCLENSHGHRSLAGYSPWGHKESDMTEVTQYPYDRNKE